MFIARPSFIFSHLPFGPDEPVGSPGHQNGTVHATDGIFKPVPATPAERSFAVICAVVGSFSAAAAYATIRVIGTRVHSLVSVNYFAVTSTVVSCLVLLIHPSIGFKMPQSTAQWLVLPVRCRCAAFERLITLLGYSSSRSAFLGFFSRCC